MASKRINADETDVLNIRLYNSFGISFHISSEHYLRTSDVSFSFLHVDVEARNNVLDDVLLDSLLDRNRGSRFKKRFPCFTWIAGLLQMSSERKVYPCGTWLLV